MINTNLKPFDLLLNAASHLFATYIVLQTTSFEYPEVAFRKVDYPIIILNLAICLFFTSVYKPDNKKFRSSKIEYIILRSVSVVFTWTCANITLGILFNKLYGRVFTSEVVFTEIFISLFLYYICSVLNLFPQKPTLWFENEDDIKNLKNLLPYSQFKLHSLISHPKDALNSNDIVVIDSVRNYNISSFLNSSPIHFVLLSTLKETLEEKKDIFDDPDTIYGDLVGGIQKPYNQGIKRCLDNIIAAFAIILSLPVVLLIWVIQKIFDPGPFFYKQTRTGLQGQTFEIIKIRSMRVDAETCGPEWAKKNDQRVTNFGKILRKTRLDELPQFYNVLKGEMSLIGPRPERPEFDLQLSKKIPNYYFRYLVRPGISGHAQLSYQYGSSVEDAAEKLKYDLYYIENVCFQLDLKIIFNTFTYFFKNSR